MDNTAPILLTKDAIFKQVSQEQIFAKFLGISIDEILWCLKVGSNLITSPLREDNNPTCGFKYAGSRLRFKDFSGHFWGDCFDLVGYLNNIDTSTKEGFMMVLDRIAEEFELYDKKPTSFGITAVQNGISRPAVNERKKLAINIIKRQWNSHDERFWSQYQIDTKFLEDNEVYACDVVAMGDEIKYNYNLTSNNDTAYCYNFGRDNNETVNDVQIYRPFRSRTNGRFRMNFYHLMGIKEVIDDKEICVITKSRKDVLCLRKMAELTNFNAHFVSVPAENYLITSREYRILRSKAKFIFTLFDFDFTGRRCAWKHKETYGIPSLFLTTGAINTRNYGSKDFSDYVKVNGTAKALQLMLDANEYIETKLKSKVQLSYVTKG